MCPIFSSAIVAPEGGNRTDDALERTQQVVVSSGAATLRILTPGAAATSSRPPQMLENNGTTPIGNTAFAALELQIGRGLRVVSGKARVRIEELPDTTENITHPLEQNHFDALVLFDTAAGWEKYYDPDGRSPKPVDWWPAPEAPSRATSQNGTVKYRYRMKWKTGAITSVEPLGFWGHRVLQGSGDTIPNSPNFTTLH